MLMKGAAKCNTHCELQNSVNQLTIERRSGLGAFLRACLCQCFHSFNGACPFLEHDECASSLKLVASNCKCCNVLGFLLDVVAETPAL